MGLAGARGTSPCPCPAPPSQPHRQLPRRWASGPRRPLQTTFLWVCRPQPAAHRMGRECGVKLPPHLTHDPKGPGLDSMSPDLSKSRLPWSGRQQSGPEKTIEAPFRHTNQPPPQLPRMQPPGSAFPNSEGIRPPGIPGEPPHLGKVPFLVVALSSSLSLSLPFSLLLERLQ